MQQIERKEVLEGLEEKKDDGEGNRSCIRFEEVSYTQTKKCK